MQNSTAQSADPLIHWILRVAAGLCFIGHGAFGFIGKESWIPFFAVVGISKGAAESLMPWVGFVDILSGFWILLMGPNLAILSYMFVWALWTALLRPLSGLPAWEFFERAGNFCVPMALLILKAPADSWNRPFARMLTQEFSAKQKEDLYLCLRLATAALMIGHGGFGAFMQKPQLLTHFQALNLFPETWFSASSLGYFGFIEMLLGLGLLAWPAPGLCLFIFVWKISTELLYPISGDYIWEFIERSATYASPLVLFLLGRENNLIYRSIYRRIYSRWRPLIPKAQDS